MDLGYFLPQGGTELIFDVCATRDIVDDLEEISILDGQSCVIDSTPLQLGQRVSMGADFDRDTGQLTIVKEGADLQFTVPGPRFRPVDVFNRIEIIARDGVCLLYTSPSPRD